MEAASEPAGWTQCQRSLILSHDSAVVVIITGFGVVIEQQSLRNLLPGVDSN